MLRDESTPEGKAIWDTVRKAAEKAPEWVKPYVERYVAEWAQMIKETNALNIPRYIVREGHGAVRDWWLANRHRLER